jgi:hypothetical protein
MSILVREASRFNHDKDQRQWSAALTPAAEVSLIPSTHLIAFPALGLGVARSGFGSAAPSLGVAGNRIATELPESGRAINFLSNREPF